MLKKRTITAITLGLSVIIGVFYLPALGFDLLALLVILLAAWEFSGLFSTWNHQARIIFLIVLTLVLLSTYSVVALPILIVGTIFWVAIVPYFLWRYTLDQKRSYFTNFVVQGMLGIITFIPCWVGLVTIRKSFGSEFLFFLLAIVWSVDIGAYLTGIFWGKHLLAPKISPKKTFEGLLGGILIAMLVAIIGVLLLKFSLAKSSGLQVDFNILSIFSLLMLSVVACLWSVIGDLFESMLKRLAGVKDSGKLLPGHGGVYDRIDSLLAAVPIFTLGLLLI